MRAPRDENRVPSMLGVSSLDFETPVAPAVDPTTHELLIGVAGLFIPNWDYLTVAYPDAVSEIYTFNKNGSGGTTVATVTLTYTDSTKAQLSIVAKT